jgi:hypothetical protein
MIINMLIKNISNDIEKNLIKLINLKPPQCYNEISDIELQKFKNMQEKNDYNHIKKELFISLRNSIIRYKMITRHSILIKNTKKMIEDYNNGVDILNISKKYDGSPLNILRIIYKSMYPSISFKTLVNYMYTKPNSEYTKPNSEYTKPNSEYTKPNSEHTQLSKEDIKQFIKANQNDKYAVINQQKMHEESLLFEKEIEKILVKNNVKYKTQEMLCKEQIKEHEKCISTPDFLISSNFVLNGIDVKWIDAKNFYGANNKFIISSIKKQTEKYIRLYGSGIIIFKLDCNEKLFFNNILCISYDQFLSITT